MRCWRSATVRSTRTTNSPSATARRCASRRAAPSTLRALFCASPCTGRGSWRARSRASSITSRCRVHDVCFVNVDREGSGSYAVEYMYVRLRPKIHSSANYDEFAALSEGGLRGALRDRGCQVSVTPTLLRPRPEPLRDTSSSVEPYAVRRLFASFGTGPGRAGRVGQRPSRVSERLRKSRHGLTSYSRFAKRQTSYCCN